MRRAVDKQAYVRGWLLRFATYIFVQVHDQIFCHKLAGLDLNKKGRLLKVLEDCGTKCSQFYLVMHKFKKCKATTGIFYILAPFNIGLVHRPQNPLMVEAKAFQLAPMMTGICVNIA